MLTTAEFAKISVQLNIDPNNTNMFSQEDIFSRDFYYCVAEPATTSAEWLSKKFRAYVDSTRSLVAFLDKEQAELFARFKKSIYQSVPMVMEIKNGDFFRIIAEYIDNGMIDSIKLYSFPPINLRIPAEDFRNRVIPSPSKIMEPSDEPSSAPVFEGIDLIKKVFSTYDRNSRRRLDPGSRYENIHTLIQSLVHQNSIEYETLDRTLELPAGYTREFCNSANSVHPSMGVIEKYLAYFGLREYLYLFKSNSTEIAKYIKEKKGLDRYEISSQSQSGAARLTLKKMEQGSGSDGYYVYRLHFENANGIKLAVIVSNPFNKVVGREYSIVGYEGPTGETSDVTSSAPVKSDEELQAIVDSLTPEKKAGQAQERTYEEKRKDTILYYFKKQGMDIRSAEAKYKDIEVEPDVLDEFYKYIETKKFGKIEIAGYSARKLIQEMKMPAYDAYLSLIQLRTDPQNTKQRLKYRQTDPQYQ